MKLTTKPKYVIGIDEAGRGPLAGPVAVGVVLIPTDFDWVLIPGVNDSKKLSEKKREEIFTIAKRLKASGQINYAVAMVSASVIDKQGITFAINLAMSRALTKVVKNSTVNSTKKSFQSIVEVKLDGGLKAPVQYIHQETIIKGDSKEKVIGLASIMAKVTRDRYMIKQSKMTAFKGYDFATHKGYGTKNHREAIAKFGSSELHRTSFVKI